MFCVSPNKVEKADHRHRRLLRAHSERPRSRRAAECGDVMDKLINELLLLTCMGTFVASATYAVTLLH
jgi:hypothetical protein